MQRLKAGLNGKVTIIEKRLQNKLSIPLSAIMLENGKSFVYVKVNNKFVRKPVLTGERNSIAVVIEKGLTGKEQIALSNPLKSSMPKKGSAHESG